MIVLIVGLIARKSQTQVHSMLLEIVFAIIPHIVVTSRFVQKMQLQLIQSEMNMLIV